MMLKIVRLKRQRYKLITEVSQVNKYQLACL